MNRNIKLLVLLIVAILVVLFFVFDVGELLTLSALKAKQAEFGAFYAEHAVFTLAVYFLIYVAVAALSLPGAAVMTLAGGALFGFLTGLVAVSFASTIGATLAFLVSRFLLRDLVQTKFGDRLGAINEGVKKDGAFYLFTLRLVPIFPFFVINLVMGLTPIRTRTFYWVSQLGMLAGTMVYVNAGTQLARIDSLSGILSPGLLFSFALLGIFPLAARKIIDTVKARRVFKDYTKPKAFDYNLVVIGAGSAGLVSAYIAAAVKAKVALIERDKMGGDCLNTGCVPSKALIRSSKMLAYTRRAKEFGFKEANVEFDFSEVMARVHTVISKVEPHDSIERYTKLGVECVQGAAEIISPFEVKVNGRVLTTKSIIIATGARPFVPPIKGMELITPLTSDSVWSLSELPKRLVVLGGGPIGCELAQCFARFGAEVTQVEMAPNLMGREDPEVAEMVARKFRNEGIRVLTGHAATEVRVEDGEKQLLCSAGDQTVTIPFDDIIVAVGRKPNTEGFGLEKLGITLAPRGTIETDPFLATSVPNIFCAGDVAGPYQFTHTASHQAWYASVNALFGFVKRFKADYSVIPWCTYTDPEVARVGLSESEAKEKNIPHEVTVYEIGEVDRAIADSEDHGFVKVVTAKGNDRILGATIVGHHAGDIIAEFVLAMRHKLGLNKILGTIHIYPTLAEMVKGTAGTWKNAHKPEKVLNTLQKVHAWRRA
ncbi:dihydrolipoyl dehydrogenase [Desulfoluna spongiiphila]|uniref:Dihydrolipoyl dehydrogenase n=1 Tax=Desulfoluna spongiiphila TaxID=419481 RepID=A0A1G5BIV9_9BACT|nr:dihydrolipoyl dehydrogenase [Desulfoluna spongiiphila]SCX90142.1 dihydrolipoamide dehydrogenase [Desulfoluna spongiiphila]VVS93766.1 dihydrolipoamide dehydrogenase [Desulfoluna spongiiphila]